MLLRDAMTFIVLLLTGLLGLFWWKGRPAPPDPAAVALAREVFSA